MINNTIIMPNCINQARHLTSFRSILVAVVVIMARAGRDNHWLPSLQMEESSKTAWQLNGNQGLACRGNTALFYESKMPLTIFTS